MDEVDLVRLVGHGDAPDEEGAKKRAFAALSAAMNEAGPRRRTLFQQGGMPRRWPLAVAAVLVIALAVSLVLPLTRTMSAAASTLQHMAAVAATRHGDSLDPGQFVYTKSQTRSLRTVADASSGHSWHVFDTVTRQAWIGPDGSGRIVESAGPGAFASKADRLSWEASGRPPLPRGGNASDEVYGPGELSFLDLAALPTDEDSLRALIEERRILPGPPGTGETVDILGDLLRETYAPPQLRASLYRITAALPGIQLLGAMTDAAGRQGIGVGYSEKGLRQELIIDPRTSVLLGERTVREDSGAAIEWAVYLKSGVVSSTSQKPT